MDNFRFNIIADSESTFKNAMAIAMSQHSKAVGYELKDSKLFFIGLRHLQTQICVHFLVLCLLKTLFPLYGHSSKKWMLLKK